jgi:hypothetical protein
LVLSSSYCSQIPLTNLEKGDLEMIPKIINKLRKVKTTGFLNNKESVQGGHSLLHHYKFGDNPIVAKAVQQFKDKKIPLI